VISISLLEKGFFDRCYFRQVKIIKDPAPVVDPLVPGIEPAAEIDYNAVRKLCKKSRA